MKKALLLFTMVVLFGCIADSGDDLPTPRAVEVYEISNIESQGTSITFTVLCQTPEPCWAYSHHENTNTSSVYLITIYAQRTTNDPCLQVLSSIEVPISVTVPNSGEFIFKFWQNDEATLDTTITIG